MFNTQSLKLHSFEELENHLRNCIHWNSTDVIDHTIPLALRFYSTLC